MSQHFKDKNFQSQHANNCDLLIQLSQARISYAIIDKTTNAPQVLFDTSLLRRNGRIEMFDKLDELLNSKEELSYRFKKVKVSVQTPHFTFIPQTLFDPTLIADYAKLINPSSNAQENVQVRDIASLGIKNVIVLDHELKTSIEERLAGAVLFSQADSFIAGMSKMVTPGDTFLALNMQPETVEFVLFNAGKLVFYNLFDCETADDLNYFLLHVIKELNLDMQQTKVSLAGDIEANDASYLCIKKYFNNIQFLNTRQVLIQSTFADQLVSHHFFSLLSLNECQ